GAGTRARPAGPTPEHQRRLERPMNKDKLKKHHFWFLLGLVPLFVLIAVLTVSAAVGDKIADERKKIDAAEKALKGKGDVKPVDLLTKLDRQVDELKVKQTELWAANW